VYGKIFDSMYDSTLADDWRALVTFQQMIVLCDADGVVDMTPHALSRRTSIPIEYIEAGLKILEAPDPYSRSPEQEGKRIELIDEHRPWGWIIVNHGRYKSLQDAGTVREQTRKRVQKHRDKKTQLNQQTCNASPVTVTQSNNKKRHTDTDTDKQYSPNGESGKAKLSPIPYQKILELYHQHCPKFSKVIKLSEKRKRAIRARWKDDADNLEYWESYFKHAATSRFLNGQNDRNWIADIDFLISERAMIGMQEGKYHG